MASNTVFLQDNVHQSISLLLFAFMLALTTSCSSPGAPNANEVSGLKTLPMATALEGSSGPQATYLGEKISSSKVNNIGYGVVIPDQQGKMVVITGDESKPLPAGYLEARELKLKIRELAEQLIADVRESSLRGAVAIPTSFVNLNAMDETSPFGRLIAEQLIYEFNQRGFPVKEFRIPKHITVKKYEGEFYLTREIGSIAPKSPSSVIIAGTYYNDAEAIFVNARILSPSSGQVIRTANLIINNNSLITRLAKSKIRKSLTSGTMMISGKNNNLAAPSTNPFDLGADIHQ